MASSTDLPPSRKDLLIASHDVLVLIFKLFIPPADAVDTPDNRFARGGRKQLLNLALTCKAFVDPALECLWYCLESLGPLFKLHPGLRTVSDPYVGESYFFRGSIDSQNSSKYHQYASRARTVYFHDRPADETAVSIRYQIAFAGYSWLGQQLQGRPLLPGLRSIHFARCPADSIHLGLLPFMLSPSVETVEFGTLFLSSPAFHSYALPLVCDELPSLIEIILHDNGNSSQISQDTWGTLGGMSTRLQSLTLRFPNTSVLQPDTLYQLAKQLPNLTSLTLDVHTPSHRESKETRRQVLPSLRILRLVNRSETRLCQCYPCFLLEKATSVTFCLRESVSNDGAFSQSLDTLSTLKALRRVDIEGSSSSIARASVRPFLQRLQLDEFHLQKVRGFLRTGGEDDWKMQSLLDAVSSNSNNGRLRHLTFPISNEMSNRDPWGGGVIINWPGLSFLLYVAQRVQGLQHLSLSLDSTAQGRNEDTVSTMIQNWTNPSGSSSTIRYLDIAEKRVSNFTPNEYRNIARLLDLIFPNLISVKLVKTPQAPTDWNEHWQLIEEHRQILKSLRLYQGGRR